MIISYYLLIIELTESLKSVSTLYMYFQKENAFLLENIILYQDVFEFLIQAFSAKELNSLIYFRTKKQ